jgi:predicted  nucleic acid-binding Zn-ribbon protein
VSTQVQLLLIVQDRDRKIMRLEREISDLPQRRKRIEAQLDSHKKALEQADDLIRKRGLEQKELESEIEARKQKIAKFRQQQFEVKNNDDYRALEKQIELVNREIVELEDRELEIMESVEQAHAVRDEKTAALKEEEKGVSEEVELFNQRAANLENELADARSARAESVAAVDPEWISRYERTFQHTGDFALVPVENNTCGGCHMKLPPQAAHDARRLDSMTLCMYCGRLLYYMP